MNITALVLHLIQPKTKQNKTMCYFVVNAPFSSVEEQRCGIWMWSFIQVLLLLHKWLRRPSNVSLSLFVHVCMYNTSLWVTNNALFLFFILFFCFVCLHKVGYDGIVFNTLITRPLRPSDARAKQNIVYCVYCVNCVNCVYCVCVLLLMCNVVVATIVYC